MLSGSDVAQFNRLPNSYVHFFFHFSTALHLLVVQRDTHTFQQQLYAELFLSLGSVISSFVACVFSHEFAVVHMNVCVCVSVSGFMHLVNTHCTLRINILEVKSIIY